MGHKKGWDRTQKETVERNQNYVFKAVRNLEKKFPHNQPGATSILKEVRILGEEVKKMSRTTLYRHLVLLIKKKRIVKREHKYSSNETLIVKKMLDDFLAEIHTKVTPELWDIDIEKLVSNIFSYSQKKARKDKQAQKKVERAKERYHLDILKKLAMIEGAVDVSVFSKKKIPPFQENRLEREIAKFLLKHIQSTIFDRMPQDWWKGISVDAEKQEQSLKHIRQLESDKQVINDLDLSIVIRFVPSRIDIGEMRKKWSKMEKDWFGIT